MGIAKFGGVLDIAFSLRKIVFVVSLLAGHITSVAESQVNYAVLEAQPTGTFVGDLLRDGNLTDGPRPTFLVRGRHRPSPLPFSVDRRSGVVRTAVPVDREALCPPASDWDNSGAADSDSEARCRVNFEVEVKTTTSSHTVRVEVEVLDLNDNSPTFPDDQVSWVELIRA